MRKWEIRRYTLTQLLNALGPLRESDDPHAGQMAIGSTEEIDEMWGEIFPG